MIDSIKTTTDLLQWFLKNEPELVKKMSECDHNFDSDNSNPFHIEGDIWCHTMLVMKEADRNNLPMELKIAALLHDIGKHIVAERVEETKKVRFFNHDPVSAFMSLDIMNKLQLNDSQKEHIFKLICLHTQPFKQDPINLQKQIKDHGLYYALLKLSEADKHGRFHTGEDVITNFDYISFPEVAKEPKNKKVILLCGLPTSGKSTYAKQLRFNYMKAIVGRDNIIESLQGSDYNDKWNNADQKLVDKILQDQFKYAKNSDANVVVIDMTHMSKKSRNRSLSRFGKEWSKECVVFLPTLSELAERAKKRTEKVIDSSVIDGMMKAFYPPLLGEGFDKIEYKF